MNVVTMKGEVPLRSLEKTGKRVMNHLPWLIELMRKRAKGSYGNNLMILAREDSYRGHSKSDSLIMLFPYVPLGI